MSSVNEANLRQFHRMGTPTGVLSAIDRSSIDRKSEKQRQANHAAIARERNKTEQTYENNARQLHSYATYLKNTQQPTWPLHSYDKKNMLVMFQ